jgi:hypothetical protein
VSDQPTAEELAEHERLQQQAWSEEDAVDQVPAPTPAELAWEDFRDNGVDLLSVDTSSPVEWVPGAEGIIRKGERQSWVANYGEGKTQAAVQFAAQVCKAGGRVIYIDVENDTREMAERLKPVIESLGDRDG